MIVATTKSTVRMLTIMVVLQAIRLKSFPLIYSPMILRPLIWMRVKRSTIGRNDPLITSESTVITSIWGHQEPGWRWRRRHSRWHPDWRRQLDLSITGISCASDEAALLHRICLTFAISPADSYDYPAGGFWEWYYLLHQAPGPPPFVFSIFLNSSSDY